MIRKFQLWALTIVVAFVLAGAAQAAPVKATLSGVKGDVQVRKSDGAAWTKAADGMKLDQGADVKTGAGGEAVLSWPVGNVVRIRPLTTLNLETLDLDSVGTAKSNLKLTGGGVLAQAGKLTGKDSQFNVKTPAAVAGVRGTALDAAIPPEGGISLAVVEGNVVLTVGDVTITIDAGFEISVSASGEVPTTPAKIPEARLKNMQSAVNVLKQIVNEMEKQEKSEAKDEKKEEKAEEKTDEDLADQVVDTVTSNTTDQTTISDSITQTATDAALGCPAGGGCIEGTISF